MRGLTRSGLHRRQYTSAAACVLAGVFLTACGDDGPRLPTDPSGPTPPVTPGRALLSLSSRDEECSTKSPVWGFLGPHALAGATVAASGSEWTAGPDDRVRSSDFQIRFRTDTTGQQSISGTMRGTVIDLLSILRFPNPDRVAVSGASGAADAVLSGVSVPELPGIVGTITGTLTYTDNQGGVTTCTTGILSLYSQR